MKESERERFKYLLDKFDKKDERNDISQLWLCLGLAAKDKVVCIDEYAQRKLLLLGYDEPGQRTKRVSGMGEGI